jgi:hypothetical protein
MTKSGRALLSRWLNLRSRIELRAQVDQAKVQSNEAINQAKLAHETQENEKDRELELIIKEVEAELKVEEGSGKMLAVMEQIKGKLADSAMKLRVQKELSAGEVITPAAEPRGRAPEGESFEK